MPGGLGVAALAIGAGWMYVRRRMGAAASERALSCAEASIPGARRVQDARGRTAVRAIVLDVPVLLHPGPPLDGDPDWMTGLGVVARYVTDGGPAFRAGSKEPDVHLRAGGPTLPLRALYGRTIPVVGDHVEARALVGRALAEIEPTGALTAPFLRSDGREVSAWIARMPTDEHLPEVLGDLTRLCASLARWKDDVLDAYAEAIGATVCIDPERAPPLCARLDLGREAGTIELEARFVREPDRLVGAHSFAVRAAGPTALALPRERVPLERLHPEAARRVSSEAIKNARRALVRGEPGRVVLEWARPPSPGEMVAAVAVLRALSPARPSAGPFR